MLNQIAQWLVKPVGALDRAHSILVNVQMPRQHSRLRTSHAWPTCIQHRTATSGCSLLLCLVYILAVFSSCWPSAHHLRSCSAEQSTADVAGSAAVGRSSIRLRPAARQRPPASRPPSPAASAPPAQGPRSLSTPPARRAVPYACDPPAAQERRRATPVRTGPRRSQRPPCLWGPGNQQGPNLTM